MKKILLGFLAFTITTTAIAQKKELSLSDAVSGRGLRPTSILDFNWMSDSKSYSFLSSDYNYLVKGFVNGDKVDTLISTKELNSIAGTDLSYIYGIDWVSPTAFRINDGSDYIEFDVKSKSAKKLVALPESAENALQHPKTGSVAYTIGNEVGISAVGGSIHEVTKIGDKNTVSGQAIARSEFGITGGLFWSPSGTRLAFYQKDESKVADYPLLDNSTTPGSLKSIKYPMAGQGSEKARVGIYDLATKKVVYFETRHGAENYLTNLSWTPDNKHVLVAEVNRDQDHMWLHVFDAQTGAYVKTLFEETSKTWIEPEHPAFFPMETSNNFVWVSERDGFNNLYYYDFDGKLIKKLTEHKFVVKDIMEFKNDEVFYTTTGDDPRETHVYSVSLDGKVRILTRAQGTHRVHIAPNGKYFHDNFSSQTVATNEWIIDARGKIVSVKMESRDKLADFKIGTTELSSIKAKDGSVLYTRLIKPSNFDPSKKYPVLVYVYGGPHAQLITDSWGTGASPWMYWMAEQGYLVYTVDNRGSAERGVAFESQIHRQLGTVEMEDQMTGVEYLKSLPYVDANRLAVHGWSFGGFMTTSLMLRHAGTFNVGVAGGPVTDWKYYEAMYGERYMDQPEQNVEGYKEASLLTHADKLTGKLLLIHGTVDPVVVMQHSLSLVQEFIRLGKQMDFFPYPMHEHNVYGPDRVHLMEKVLTYIIENNQ